MADTVKISVFIDREIHRKLKILAAEADTSIQQMVEDAVNVALSRENDSNTIPVSGPITQKEIRAMKRNFARIVESGDDEIVKCFTIFVRAMGMLVEKRVNHEF